MYRPYSSPPAVEEEIYEEISKQHTETLKRNSIQYVHPIMSVTPVQSRLHACYHNNLVWPSTIILWSRTYWQWPKSVTDGLKAHTVLYEFGISLCPCFSGYAYLTSLLRITARIGSGQFASVEKGLWRSPNGMLEVAVKTLHTDASQLDKVKLLQEAAIMGQFRHPNVVRLLGVVSEGDAVSIPHLCNDSAK